MDPAVAAGRKPGAEERIGLHRRGSLTECFTDDAIGRLSGSIISLLGLTLRASDHAPLGRRSATPAVPRPSPTAAIGDARPLPLLVDSAGLKLCGAGEWLVENTAPRLAERGGSCISGSAPRPARSWHQH
jgi:hypothetical protein